jgi:hypothetical protein
LHSSSRSARIRFASCSSLNAASDSVGSATFDDDDDVSSTPVAAAVVVVGAGAAPDSRIGIGDFETIKHKNDTDHLLLLVLWQRLATLSAIAERSQSRSSTMRIRLLSVQTVHLTSITKNNVPLCHCYRHPDVRIKMKLLNNNETMNVLLWFAKEEGLAESTTCRSRGSAFASQRRVRPLKRSTTRPPKQHKNVVDAKNLRDSFTPTNNKRNETNRNKQTPSQ